MRSREHDSFRQGRNGSTQIYRARDGMICGVCKGIADTYNINVLWVRVAIIFLALTTTVWPVIIVYFILAFVMKPEPVIPFGSTSEHEFYDSFTNSRSMALQRLRNKFENLSARLHRMEDIVTSRDFKWQNDMQDIFNKHN